MPLSALRPDPASPSIAQAALDHALHDRQRPERELVNWAWRQCCCAHFSEHTSSFTKLEVHRSAGRDRLETSRAQCRQKCAEHDCRPQLRLVIIMVWPESPPSMNVKSGKTSKEKYKADGPT